MKDGKLPGNWPRKVRSAIIHVISLAHVAITQARGRAANSRRTEARLRAQVEQAKNEILLLEEELRIKDARMARVDPPRRPHYRPVDRLAILELRAARGWTAIQTAGRFLVQQPTISSWLRRVDEGGEYALVQTPVPVNKFPDFVRHIVTRLKILCPTMGKTRIAQTLARAGLHLGRTTVGRLLKEEPILPADSAALEEEDVPVRRTVTAKYPNHLWHVDLSVVPTSAGFWASWSPFAVPQWWPYCWWLACAVDHFSRRVMGFALFFKQPTSIQVRSFLGKAMGKIHTTPKYIISDKGGQFWNDEYKEWCGGKGITPRYSSVGEIGGIALIERFFKSLKDEWLRCTTVPFRREAMRRHISSYLAWFHESRPHQGLSGRTPQEVYTERKPANERARFEPRSRWPQDSLCAEPWVNPRKRQPSKLRVVVKCDASNRLLPVIELKPAA